MNSPFFDSLTHVSPDGTWLGRNHFDASLDRLLKEAGKISGYRACLVNIHGYQDNAYLEEVAKEYPELFVPIAGFDPSTHETPHSIRKELSELYERNFAGIKLHPRLNGYDPLDNRALYAIQEAARFNLVVFVDTLFRQLSITTKHTPDVIDKIAQACPDTKIILLHGGGTSMLDVYEIVRMRSNLMLDLSFSMMRYRGSSLDMDIRFICRTLDQRMTLGSDFPEYTPRECLEVALGIVDGLPEEKINNILHNNLHNMLHDWLSRN
ncbi:amidohydrolase family protein [Halomonas sp. M4R1S46]|uniref:amidohydrolase family protein n=1 Tax=Halomonas sp. M4R1S46 TaxID=2982692 RepID=UPI0021E45BD7|nr:amidohydrolase family protein [Halomonas sp. M4R1S46]UYG06242.1 amidohydrolase family protein [Halomonas sp. M4R1S46]